VPGLDQRASALPRALRCFRLRWWPIRVSLIGIAPGLTNAPLLCPFPRALRCLPVRTMVAQRRTMAALSALLDLTAQISDPLRKGLVINDDSVRTWELTYALKTAQVKDVLDFMVQEGIIILADQNLDAGEKRWRYNGPFLGNPASPGYHGAVATAFYNALSQRFLC
jgi:hypothetical protein